MLRYTIVAIVAIAACSKGTSKSEESRKRLGAVCADPRSVLLQGHSDGVTSDMMATALQVCSKACDLGDDPSCIMLDGYIGRTCTADQDFCKRLATFDDMPALSSRAKAKLKP
jgi:hypothetical protein